LPEQARTFLSALIYPPKALTHLDDASFARDRDGRTEMSALPANLEQQPFGHRKLKTLWRRSKLAAVIPTAPFSFSPCNCSVRVNLPILFDGLVLAGKSIVQSRRRRIGQFKSVCQRLTNPTVENPEL
jgi:hypothetical protein